MKLKQNWSLEANQENAEVYKQTLIALGYLWCNYSCEYDEDMSFIRTDAANKHQVFFSSLTEEDHFQNIEEFLKWHFISEKTEQQLKIEALENTIAQAQRELQELKEMQ